MASRAKGPVAKRPGAHAPEGSWAWLKEWTGYIVTVLPYVSAGLVLIPTLSITVKGAILFVFAVAVLVIRFYHEKAGEEVTSSDMKQKRV
ncbi:MAG TPA: hypothetical protein VGZ02_14355 [Candidatus Baltobacteraceae bacterium]|jgi:hypothetical protein|nr:hypothetical protein [Candidatus Baltobacteraceae bacterium]